MKTNVRYNREMCIALQKLSQEAHDRLLAYGTTLGWWHTVAFGRTHGFSPDKTAQRVLELHALSP